MFLLRPSPARPKPEKSLSGLPAQWGPKQVGMSWRLAAGGAGARVEKLEKLEESAGLAFCQGRPLGAGSGGQKNDFAVYHFCQGVGLRGMAGL